MVTIISCMALQHFFLLVASNLTLILAPSNNIIKYGFDRRCLEYDLLKFKESKANGIRLSAKFSSANLKSSSLKSSLHTEMGFGTAARSCNKFPWIMVGRCYTTQ